MCIDNYQKAQCKTIGSWCTNKAFNHLMLVLNGSHANDIIMESVYCRVARNIYQTIFYLKEYTAHSAKQINSSRIVGSAPNGVVRNVWSSLEKKDAFKE